MCRRGVVSAFIADGNKIGECQRSLGDIQMNLWIELKKHNRTKMLLTVRGRLLRPNESAPLEPVALGSRKFMALYCEITSNYSVSSNHSECHRRTPSMKRGEANLLRWAISLLGTAPCPHSQLIRTVNLTYVPELPWRVTWPYLRYNRKHEDDQYVFNHLTLFN